MRLCLLLQVMVLLLRMLCWLSHKRITRLLLMHLLLLLRGMVLVRMLHPPCLRSTCCTSTTTWRIIRAAAKAQAPHWCVVGQLRKQREAGSSVMVRNANSKCCAACP